MNGPPTPSRRVFFDPLEYLKNRTCSLILYTNRGYSEIARKGRSNRTHIRIKGTPLNQAKVRGVVALDTSPTVKIRRHPRYRLQVASVARDSSRIDSNNGGPTGFHLGVGLELPLVGNPIITLSGDKPKPTGDRRLECSFYTIPTHTRLRRCNSMIQSIQLPCPY